MTFGKHDSGVIHVELDAFEPRALHGMSGAQRWDGNAIMLLLHTLRDCRASNLHPASQSHREGTMHFHESSSIPAGPFPVHALARVEDRDHCQGLLHTRARLKDLLVECPPAAAQSRQDR
jgi:hypothetical protein